MSNPKRNITDSPFFAAMGFLGDVVVLNLLWLVFCLPLVTAGAATTAAFSVAGKMAARQDYFVRRDFWAAFKRDWRLATRAWLLLVLAGAVIVTDYRIGLANPGSLGGGLIALAAVLGVVWLCALGGGFALLGRFAYGRAGSLLRDGVLLCAANLKAALVWLALVLAMPLLRLCAAPVYYYLLPPWTLVGGGAAITAFAFALRPAFVKLENKPKNTN